MFDPCFNGIYRVALKAILGHRAWSWTTLRGSVFYYVYERFFSFLSRFYVFNFFLFEHFFTSIIYRSNGPLSGTTRVNRYQKAKTKLNFTEARDSEWKWHQLGHMQICTLLQTDNHASTSISRKRQEFSYHRPAFIIFTHVKWTTEIGHVTTVAYYAQSSDCTAASHTVGPPLVRGNVSPLISLPLGDAS